MKTLPVDQRIVIDPRRSIHQNYPTKNEHEPFEYLSTGSNPAMPDFRP